MRLEDWIRIFRSMESVVFKVWKREKWLRMALMREDDFQLAVQVNSLYTLDEIMEDEPQESEE